MDILPIILHILEIVGVLIGILGPVIGFCYNSFKKAGITLQKIGESLRFIDELRSELRPNGGKNLRGSIDRQEIISTLLLSESDNAIFICDKDGEMTYANPALCEMFGLPQEKMLGRGWTAAIDEKTRNEVWQSWMDTIKNGLPYSRTLKIENQSSKNKFSVKSSAIKQPSIHGQAVAYFGTIKVE